MNLLMTFIVLSILNVVLSTARSLIVVKCGKYVSAIASAVYFGFYTVVLIYMSCPLTLWEKVGITAVCNLIGVYLVKLFEEKTRKDKLWRITATFHIDHIPEIRKMLNNDELPYSYNVCGKHAVYDIYCNTQADTVKATKIIKQFNGKTFVTENKTIL